jgi:hypothetical protein
MFGSGREEDRLTGYLSFLKIGPQLLKFIPGGHLCVCVCRESKHVPVNTVRAVCVCVCM